MAENLERLGTLYRRLGRYGEADSLYRVALTMKTSLLGPNDPAVAQTLYLLGFLMPYLSRMEESETLYKRALAIQQSAKPPDAQRTETMIQLATILSRRGKQDEAESFLREAVAERTVSDGPDAITTAEAKMYLADFLNGVREDHAGAERLYREAVGIFRGSPDAGLNRLTHATNGLANATDALGRPKEAEDMLRGLVELQRERFGAEPSLGGWIDGGTRGVSLPARPAGGGGVVAPSGSRNAGAGDGTGEPWPGRGAREARGRSDRPGTLP